MRIFVSWSGPESRRVAELLKEWMPHVVQRAELYVSSQDIEKGERWAASISASLADIDFGIIVVTPANIDAPWVNFEAGALSKSVKSRVVPLLCGMERIDAASSPLRQFQYALANKDELQRLVMAVNESTEKPLDPSRVEIAFHKWWPEFEEVYNSITFESPSVGPKSESDTRLGKIENALEAIMGDLTRIRRDALLSRGPSPSTPVDRYEEVKRWIDNAHRDEVLRVRDELQREADYERSSVNDEEVVRRIRLRRRPRPRPESSEE